MMDFKAFLEWARVHAPEQHTKGKWFEQAVKTWMKSDPRFNTQMRDIWLWNEFPGHALMGGGDLGIALVAEMVTAGSDQASEFWAIQCKFYDKTTIAKEHVDSFVAHSAGEFEIRGKMRCQHRHLGAEHTNARFRTVLCSPSCCSVKLITRGSRMPSISMMRG